MIYPLYYHKSKNIKITNRDKVLDVIYEQEARVPTKEQVKEHLKDNKDIIEYFGNNIEDKLQQLKIDISLIDIKIPLYDPYGDNLYLIARDNVYNRVVRHHYRFPDIELYKRLVNKYNKGTKALKELDPTGRGGKNNVLVERRYKKRGLMIDYLSQFDLDVLKSTYLKIYYEKAGDNITTCKRPSFIPYYTHITPYYSRSEIINLALNLGIIKPGDKYDINRLCEMIQDMDIDKDIILKHQDHIANENKIGLIQYYSLTGSYFMNNYLRGLTEYQQKNLSLEEQIKSMWNLVITAPEFDKEYTLYRFIETDDFLQHLQTGDTYVDTGFMSTTRDPFYSTEGSEFGLILLKITIPAKKRGIALCIEPYSNFQNEQEIILPPLSILKLEGRDKDISYYHTDDNLEIKIKTKYQFRLTGHKKIELPNRESFGDIPTYNFMEMDSIDAISMEEKIDNFIFKLNVLYQFNHKIGETLYTIQCEHINASGAYRKFYANKDMRGLIMYVMKDNYIHFTIELTENGIDVNYYFRYGTAPPKENIDDNDFIEFIAKLSYYFKIPDPIIYAKYKACLPKGDTMYNNYCYDIYQYLKTGKRKYANLSEKELKPMYDLYHLDRLHTTSVDIVLRKTDSDEIYQYYKRMYKADNIAAFYIWLVENHCHMTNIFVQKLIRLYKFKESNPFLNDYYILDAPSYLYNKKIIGYIPRMKQTHHKKRSIFSSGRYERRTK